MSVENWIHDLEQQSKRAYVRHLEIVERSDHMVKARLILTDDLFIQVYRNERYDSTNLVLIHNRQRLYGRDQLGGSWHRHSIDSPAKHDRSQEGRRPVDLSEFLNEVETILADLDLP